MGAVVTGPQHLLVPTTGVAGVDTISPTTNHHSQSLTSRSFSKFRSMSLPLITTAANKPSLLRADITRLCSAGRRPLNHPVSAEPQTCPSGESQTPLTELSLSGQGTGHTEQLWIIHIKLHQEGFKQMGEGRGALQDPQQGICSSSGLRQLLPRTPQEHRWVPREAHRCLPVP